MGGRRTLIVLAVLALLAVGLFVLGVAGTARGGTGDPWPAWASPRAVGGDPLTPEDLRSSVDCRIQGDTIIFVGGCVVEVVPLTEGFPWQRISRATILTAGPVDIQVGVTMAGQTMRTDLDAGEAVRISFTRDGGHFTLTCASATPCAALLVKDA